MWKLVLDILIKADSREKLIEALEAIIIQIKAGTTSGEQLDTEAGKEEVEFEFSLDGGKN